MVDVVATQFRQFSRGVELVIASQAKGDFFKTGGNAIVITEARVVCQIKKNLSKEPNTTTLTVYNLAPESRQLLNRLPVYLTMRAGHDGVLRPLFSGNVNFAVSNYKSPDWITKIQVADGGRAYAHARVSRSYAPPVNVRRVLEDAAASMSLTLPDALLTSPAMRQNMPTGFTANGFTRDVLTKILAPLDLSWSIQNGQLQVLGGKDTTGREAWVIDLDHGMIGSPESTVPSKSGSVSETSVESLLFPEISPADIVQITSRSIDHGFFRVSDVAHDLDSLTGPWKTSLKTTPLGSPPKRKKGKR